MNQGAGTAHKADGDNDGQADNSFVYAYNS